MTYGFPRGHAVGFRNVANPQAPLNSPRLVGEASWMNWCCLNPEFGAAAGLKTASFIGLRSTFRCEKLPGSLCSCGSCHCIMLAVSSGCGWVGWWRKTRNSWEKCIWDPISFWRLFLNLNDDFMIIWKQAILNGIQISSCLLFLSCVLDISILPYLLSQFLWRFDQVGNTTGDAAALEASYLDFCDGKGVKCCVVKMQVMAARDL